MRLVQLGAVRPIVAMLASDAEPRHYAGLALLKLADNFENHLRIAEEGGIQALLRLGRAKSSDEQVQYKAALTVGMLASNAVRLMPKIGLGAGQQKEGGNGVGHGAKVMDRLREQVRAHTHIYIHIFITYIIYIYMCCRSVTPPTPAHLIKPPPIHPLPRRSTPRKGSRLRRTTSTRLVHPHA